MPTWHKTGCVLCAQNCGLFGRRGGNVIPGMVLIPHGFGLLYNGKVYGINVYRLTKNTHRDPLATPLHRFVPCRVENA